MLEESVLSTLHRGGEGQNVYRMIFFSNPCDQGCSLMIFLFPLSFHLTEMYHWNSYMYLLINCVFPRQKSILLVCPLGSLEEGSSKKDSLGIQISR